MKPAILLSLIAFIPLSSFAQDMGGNWSEPRLPFLPFNLCDCSSHDDCEEGELCYQAADCGMSHWNENEILLQSGSETGMCAPVELFLYFEELGLNQ